MKKYVLRYAVRLLAALPPTAVSITAVFFGIASVDYPVLSILAIFNFIAGIILFDKFEYIVFDLKNFLKILSEKTDCYV